MRKLSIAVSVIAALTAAALTPAGAQEAQDNSSTDNFGTTEYVNNSSEPEDITEVRESIQSSGWLNEATEGTELPDGVQGAIDGSTIPNSLNPIDLANRDIVASSQLFEGDTRQSSAAATTLLSDWLFVVAVGIVIGQIIELVMRGVRIATN